MFVSWSALCVLGLALAMAAIPGCQQAERFPNRPMLLVVAWAAGGGTDRISRQIAVQLEAELGVPVNVVNATGGAGVTGHARGAFAPADGYTLMTITPELVMFHWRGLSTLSHRDFDPLMAISGDYAALFVRSDSPLATLDDAVQAIRDRRGTADPVRVSGTSHLGTWHVAVGGWLDDLGMSPTDIIWVPLAGAAPSLQQLLAGGVEIVCCSVPEAYTLLESGRIRCLAVMSEQRIAATDAPTLRETARPENRSQFVLYGWRGVALPRGVPAERREKVLAALDRVIQSQEYRDFLTRTRFGYQRELPDEFSRTLDDADQSYGKILTSPAFTAIHRQPIGPLSFPLVLGGLGLLVGVALWWRGDLTPADAGATLTWHSAGRVAAMLAFVTLFIFAGDALGFVLCAAIGLAGLLVWLRVAWPLALGLPLTVVPLVYHLFAKVLRVPLPWGLLGW